MFLFEVLVRHLRVKDVPELIVEYLAGDECLDDQTINIVFRNVYTDEYGYTYLDKTKTVLHSFNDQPAIVWSFYDQWVTSWWRNGGDTTTKSEWYRNGCLYRHNCKPVIVVCSTGENHVGEYTRHTNIYINNNNTFHVRQWDESDKSDESQNGEYKDYARQPYDVVHMA